MADDSKGGRIAIKFGAPSSSSSHSSKTRPKPTPASSLGKRPRTHHAFGGGAAAAAGSDSDDDDDKKRGQHEAITGFGANGAETERARSKEEPKKKEYVIARQPNRDWRDEMRAQRGARRSNNLLPADARAAAAQDGASGGSSMDTAPADQDAGIQWGLTVTEKKKPADAGTPSAATADDDAKDTPVQAGPAAAQPPPPRSADDEAMDALLGKRPAKDTSPRVIVTEDDAYARDVSAAGATSTLADYDAMPVEEFGAALLRGMGWNGEPSSTSLSKSNQARMPQRRQNRLGLGAKALNEAEHLGGWHQTGPASGAAKKRPPKLADYRREEERKREGRAGGGRGESYKREREREREERRRGGGERERRGPRHVDGDEERERERHRGYDRDRRR